MLTTFDLDDYVYEAIRAGASGFLLKSAPPQQLVAGVRAVMAGDALLAPEITRRLLDRFVQRPPPSHGTPPELAELTTRELEVLRLIADGRSNAEIAAALVPERGDRQDARQPHPHQARLRDRVQAVVARLPHGPDGRRLIHPGRWNCVRSAAPGSRSARSASAR